MAELNPGNGGRAGPKGVGFGTFLVLAGTALLEKRLGSLPQNLDWLLPAILITWAASDVFQRLGGD